MATNVGNSWFIFTQLMQGHELRSTPHSKILFKFVCKECNWVLTFADVGTCIKTFLKYFAIKCYLNNVSLSSLLK